MTPPARSVGSAGPAQLALRCAALCVFMLGACAGPPDDTEPDMTAWQSLVDAELAFAADASERGISPGFLNVLAEDGVVFQPDAVNGREWHQANASPDDALLLWHPRKAAVSADGSLGFTTGPWTFRPSPADAPIAAGHYVSIWRAGPTGWRLALDVGVSHPPMSDQETPVDAVPLPVDARADSLDAYDTAGPGAAESALQSRLGAGAPVNELLAPGVIVYREQAAPDTGAVAFESLPRPAPLLHWTVQGDGVAGSGDLGYTYGRFDAQAGDASDAIAGNFLRIWRRGSDGGWIVMLDLLTQHPPAPATDGA